MTSMDNIIYAREFYSNTHLIILRIYKKVSLIIKNTITLLRHPHMYYKL